MRKYQCHKTVEAAEIVGVYSPRDAGWADGYVAFLNDDGERCVQPSETGKGNLFARGKPHVGDYLVKYDDGYMAWSLKQAFEDGYTPIREASDTRHPTLQPPAAGSHASHMKPSVGAVVHYLDSHNCLKPAMVTCIFTSSRVSLCVFPTGGDDQIVPILVEDVGHRGPTNTGAGWSWPWEVAP